MAADIPPWSPEPLIDGYPLRLPQAGTIRVDFLSVCRYRAKHFHDVPPSYKSFDEVILQPRASRENPCYTTKFSVWDSWNSFNDRSFKLYKHVDRTLKVPSKAVCRVYFHYYSRHTMDITLEREKAIKGWWARPREVPWPWPFLDSPLSNTDVFSQFRCVHEVRSASSRAFRVYCNYPSRSVGLTSKTGSIYDDAAPHLSCNTIVNSEEDGKDYLIGYIDLDNSDGSIWVSMDALCKVDNRSDKEKMLDEIIVILVAVMNQQSCLRGRDLTSGNSDTNTSAVVTSISAI